MNSMGYSSIYEVENTEEQATTHPCIYCRETRVWALKDGRLKCRRCKHKFRWKSIWQSVRIPEEPKRQLVSAFAQRLPLRIFNQRVSLSAPTRDRFIKTIRAALAYAEGYRAPFPLSSIIHAQEGAGDERDGWSPDGTVLLLRLSALRGKITIVPFGGEENQEFVGTIIAKYPPGTLIPQEDPISAWVWLWLRGHHVLVPRGRLASAGTPTGTDLEACWNFALHGAGIIHRLTFARFHLFLGEMCYRFHRRQINLVAPITELLQTTSIQAIRPLLGPPQP